MDTLLPDRSRVPTPHLLPKFPRRHPARPREQSAKRSYILITNPIAHIRPRASQRETMAFGMVTVDIAAKTELSPANVPEWAGISEVHPIIQLWGGVSNTEISVLLVAIAIQNHFTGCDGYDAISRQIIKDETPMLAGGVRIMEGDRMIMPGCCCGLEDWREQAQALVRGSGWLGHDPAPWVRVKRDVVEVWSDGGLEGASRSRPDVFSLSVAKQLVAEVEVNAQRDLMQFLYAVKRWGYSVMGKHLSDELVAKLDTSWQISIADIPENASTGR